MSKNCSPRWCWAVVNKALLWWTREVKRLRGTCVSCPVLGLTGAALDQKLQEKGLIPPRSAGPLLLSLCSLRKQSKSPVKSQQQCHGAGRTKSKLCLSVSGPGVCSCSCVMQLGSAVQGAPWVCYLYSIFLHIFAPKQFAPLGSNGTMVLKPSKITTSSLISGSCVPPGHLGNLALVFVLAHLAIMGFVAVVEQIKILSSF